MPTAPRGLLKPISATETYGAGATPAMPNVATMPESPTSPSAVAAESAADAAAAAAKAASAAAKAAGDAGKGDADANAKFAPADAKPAPADAKAPTSAPAPADDTPRVIVTAEELVANLKESLVAQRRRALEERGEHLTIMCIGESGSGKTALAQSLVVQALPPRGKRAPRELDIKETAKKLVMGGDEETCTVHLRLVDSPGYGDAPDVEASFKEVSDYIEASFLATMAAESAPARPGADELAVQCGVDAVLYFIAPHRLKELDVRFLKRIHKLASVLPIISKADTMTASELAEFRVHVKNTLAENDIDTFADPFAVIACNVSEENGEVVYPQGREYPWGTALVDDPAHSDLPRLREVLLTQGLTELHAARQQKYENYRRLHGEHERARWLGIRGMFRRFRKAVTLIAVHTVIGLAAIRGVQRHLGDGKDDKDSLGKAVGDAVGRVAESAAAGDQSGSKSGRWGRGK